MMEALKVMTYFKVSLSTHNWDIAYKNQPSLSRVGYIKRPENQSASNLA
jgi:hypothetical protein